MSERQEITYMQARIIRLASEEWGLPVQDVVELFNGFKALQYIADCYGIFHAEGDDAVFEDVKIYLRGKGAGIDA